MKFSQRKILGFVLLFIGLALVCLGLSWLLGPPQFQATARIKTERDIFDTPLIEIVPDPNWIQTIQSDAVLSNVVTALNLKTIWSNKFATGRKLSPAEAIALLKKRLVVARVRNTKITAIKVRSDDPVEAAKIANTIADAYIHYREESRRLVEARALEVLLQQYDEQTRQISVMQTNVDSIRKALHISDIASAQQATTTLPEEQMRDLAHQVTEDMRDYKQLMGEVNQLKTYDKTKLRDVLPSIIEDSELSAFLSKLHEAEQEKAKLPIDYNPTNPMVAHIQTSIDTLNRQIDERVAGAMAGLGAKVKAKKDAMDAITETLEDAKAKDLANATQNQPYYDAKFKLTELMDQHRLFYAKMESDRIDSTIPKSSMVQIVDIAEPPTSPISPNRPLGAAMLVVGLITALGGWLLLMSGHEAAD